MLCMQLGDPTAYGNMPPCPAIISAITKALQSPITMGAGYINACGSPRARAAIANHHSNLSKMEDGKNAVEVSADDVIVANGASGALELALTALHDEGSVLLGKFLLYDSYQGSNEKSRVYLPFISYYTRL